MSAVLSQTLIGIGGTSIKFPQGTNVPIEQIEDKVIVVQQGILKICDKTGILILRLNSGEILDSDFLEILEVESKEAYLQAESELILLLVKSDIFKRALDENSDWNDHLKNSRKSIFKRLVKSVCTTNSCMENQIEQYLINLKEIINSKELSVTHASIAQDLGSVREVVSRTLKKLEKEGKVILKRGKIILI